MQVTGMLGPKSRNRQTQFSNRKHFECSTLYAQEYIGRQTYESRGSAEAEERAKRLYLFR